MKSLSEIAAHRKGLTEHKGWFSNYAAKGYVEGEYTKAGYIWFFLCSKAEERCVFQL